MRDRRVVTLLALAVVVAGLAGCSTSDEAGPAVSEAEYRQAVQSAAECLIDRGWDARVEPNAYGQGFDLAISTGEGELNDASEVRMESDYQECMDSTGAAALESDYLAGLELSGAERDALYAEFIVCLEEAGVAGVQVGDSEAEVGDAIGESTQGAECMQRYLLPLFGDGR